MKTVGAAFLTLVAVAAIAPSSAAEDQGKPIQLALLAPVRLFDESTPITGVRLSLLYGKNTSVTGLD